jgi:hypothetical protein
MRFTSLIALVCSLTACVTVPPDAVVRDTMAPFPQRELEAMVQGAPRSDPSSPPPKLHVYRQASAINGSRFPPTGPYLWAYFDGKEKHEFWRWWMKIYYAAWWTSGPSPTDPKIAGEDITVELFGTACNPRRSQSARDNVTEISAVYELTTKGAPAWSCVPSESCVRACGAYGGHRICTPTACGGW